MARQKDNLSLSSKLRWLNGPELRQSVSDSVWFSLFHEEPKTPRAQNSLSYTPGNTQIGDIFEYIKNVSMRQELRVFLKLLLPCLVLHAVAVIWLWFSPVQEGRMEQGCAKVVKTSVKKKTAFGRYCAPCAGERIGSKAGNCNSCLEGVSAIHFRDSG